VFTAPICSASGDNRVEQRDHRLLERIRDVHARETARREIVQHPRQVGVREAACREIDELVAQRELLRERLPLVQPWRTRRENLAANEPDLHRIRHARRR
jgi:hypothetical protein